MILREIIQHETNMNSEISTLKQKSNHLKYVFPEIMKSKKFDDYLDLKIHFKQLLGILLRIRSEFNNKLKIDIWSPLYTVQDVEPAELHIEKVFIKSKFSENKNKKYFIDWRRNHNSKLIIIVLFTLLCGSVASIAIYFTDYYKFLGVSIMFSKGFSFSIISATVLVSFFISFDILTLIRSKWRGRWCLSWLDHNLAIHKFCGYLITFYGICHSICHLWGTFVILSRDSAEDRHKITDSYDNKYKNSYIQLLFTSITGLTGIILLLIMIIISLTSMEWVRKRRFQLFGYTHMTLFPLFLILLIIHGFGFWYTLITPMTVIFISPWIVVLGIQLISRLLSGYFYPFKIIDVSISANCNYIMIFLSKPSNYKLVHGQFVYVNIPEISLLQWHPFTVASSPNSPFLILMLKVAGDWTGRLAQVLYDCKKKMLKFDELWFSDHNEYDVFNLLHDLHQEIPLKEMKDRNKVFYPKIRVGKACATPNDTFMHRKNIILVGAGSGISPYLPLLEEAIRSDKGKNSQFNFESVRVIFVARDGEQVSWISNYLFHLISADWVIPQFEFYVFITLQKELKTLPTFLFWRAFLLIQRNKHAWNYNKLYSKNLLGFSKFRSADQTSLRNTNEMSASPIIVLFGRPNFKDLFKSFIDQDSKEFYVYSTTSPPVNETIFDSAYSVTKETGVKFHHIYEATS